MRTITIGLAFITALVVPPACGGNQDNSTGEVQVLAPSNLKAEPLDGAAHLTWQDNSDNEATFMIERKSTGADWAAIATVPFDTTQYHDAGLQPGTTYVYRVMAMPKAGEKGSYSNEATCSVPAKEGAVAAAAESSGKATAEAGAGAGAAANAPTARGGSGGDSAGRGGEPALNAGAGAGGAAANGGSGGSASSSTAGAGTGGTTAGSGTSGSGGSTGGAGTAGGASGHDAHH